MEDMTDLMIYRNFVESVISPHVTEVNMMGWALLGLGAETGEMEGLAEKALRTNQPLNVDKFMDEAGDALYFWMATIIAAGLDPDEVMEYNISKLSKRKMEGTLLDSTNASDKN